MALVGGLQRARAASASAPLAVALLLAANLLPLGGVLFLGWDVLTILALYWIENGIVGVFNVLRIRRAEGPDRPRAGRGGLRVAGRNAQHGRGYLASFFAFHYGLFWVVHGVFVFAIPAFAGDGISADVYAGLSLPALVIGGTALAISHGASYVRNYLGRREYLLVSAGDQFGQPYPRLFVLHITILAGAWLLIASGQPVALVALLVVLKTVLDLALHLREHRRLQARARDLPAGASVSA